MELERATIALAICAPVSVVFAPVVVFKFNLIPNFEKSTATSVCFEIPVVLITFAMETVCV